MLNRPTHTRHIFLLPIPQMLDAINAYEGRVLYNLVPLVREKYGEDNNKLTDSYYAVAVRVLIGTNRTLFRHCFL